MANDILFVLSLVLLNGMLSFTESAFQNSRRSRLENLARKGGSGPRRALGLLGKIPQMQSMVRMLMGFSILLAGLVLGSGIQVDVQNWISSQGIVPEIAHFLSFALLLFAFSFAYFVFGESFPQHLGQRNPEKTASLLSPLIATLQGLLYPFLWLFSGVTSGLLRMVGYKTKEDDAQVTEEEVKEIIAQGTNSGTIAEMEQDMMERVLRLGDRSVASIMTNRIEVEWLDVNESPKEILEKIMASNHSLFPVCDDEIDRLVGVLSSKKYLVSLQADPVQPLRQLVDQVRVIPENMKALTALEEFKASKTKIAVVVDEYGSVQGVLTQSDLFESIIAEHDVPDEENETSIVQRDENSYLIDALLPFEEFLQYFEIAEVSPEDRTGFHSLAGFILHLSKQIPSTGDRFAWKNYDFEVVDMDGNRIDKIMVNIREPEEG
jgi:putative hemolysin